MVLLRDLSHFECNDDFVRHLVRFLEWLGPGTHVVAVCQSTVATLAAAALMAEDGNPAQPRSMTLIAGPNDTRINPTLRRHLGRPYLGLLQFFLNHRRYLRSERAERIGKSPRELDRPDA
jgi:poly-beta-hydroxyalkanoate depolymerase